MVAWPAVLFLVFLLWSEVELVCLSISGTRQSLFAGPGVLNGQARSTTVAQRGSAARGHAPSLGGDCWSREGLQCAGRLPVLPCQGVGWLADGPAALFPSCHGQARGYRCSVHLRLLMITLRYHWFSVQSYY